MMNKHDYPSHPTLENDPWAEVAEAFGRKASVYESFGKNHPNLDRMRSRVRKHLSALLTPGARLLEINAGTGLEAVYFASRGYRVHATDVSLEMVQAIQKKIRNQDLDGQLTVEQLSFTDLDHIQQGSFDGVLSNLGGVNCIGQLEPITSKLARLLRPGAVVVWVVMPPFCLWEFAQVLRGNFRLALRRLHKGGIDANIEGLFIKTYYYWPEQVQKAFGPDFKILKLEGLSVFTPPADHKAFAGRYPGLYRWLVWADDLLAARCPFNHWGDFFILSLEYRPAEKDRMA